MQCSIIVTHHSTRTHARTHTHRPDRKITFYQNSNPWLHSVDIYPTNLPHRQLMGETWLIQSNTLYTQFHATQWHSPTSASLSYNNIWDTTVDTVNWEQFKVNSCSLPLWNVKDRTDFLFGFFVMLYRCKLSFSVMSTGILLVAQTSPEHGLWILTMVKTAVKHKRAHTWHMNFHKSMITKCVLQVLYWLHVYKRTITKILLSWHITKNRSIINVHA
jgi:hypothetical protein